MNPRRLPSILRFCAGVLLISLAEVSMAQTGTSSTTQENGAVLTKLYPPAYPPIAKTARVTGDVKLQIKVTREGTVSSVNRSEEHTSELQSLTNLVCRLLLE